MNSKASNESLGLLLTKASRLYSYALQARFADAGSDVTFEQFLVLQFLGEMDGVSQQTLANHFMKNKASITSIVDNLLRAKLIKRADNKDDRRSKLVSITESGKKAVAKLTPLVNNATKDFTKKISQADHAVLKKALGRMVDNIAE